jgi:predicted outer membrane protein
MLQAQFVVLALVIIVTAAGCGSAKGKTPATTSSYTATATTASETQSGKPLTRAEWIAAGEAICKRTNAQLGSLHIKSLKDYARVLPQAASYDQAESSELGRLVPPASMASDWKKRVSGFNKFGD